MGGVLRGEAAARVGGEVALHGRGQVAGQQGQQLHVQPVQHVAQELVGVLLLVTPGKDDVNIRAFSIEES